VKTSVKDALKAAHQGAAEIQRDDLPSVIPSAKRDATDRDTTLVVGAKIAKRLKRAAVERDQKLRDLTAEILEAWLEKNKF
jgi:hypothetical protein